MGNLIFYYGTMGCSKTANALMTRFQYLQKGKTVWLIKPSIDTRDDIIDSSGVRLALVKSRVGIEAKAELIDLKTDITLEYVDRYDNFSVRTDNLQKNKNIIYNSSNVFCDVIICDEAQFLTEAQVEQLKDISSNSNTEVICYGLRTDFKTKLFPGSKRLFELADRVVELDNICDCGKRAIINARISSTGKIITHGAQIEIGGDDKYKAICWDCYKKNI